MFSRIMVPVDLAHADSLAKALDCAANLAKQHGAEVVYVGVTGEQPGTLAHNPAEYEEKLRAFSEERGGESGIRTRHHAIVSHDPTSDLEKNLLRAIDDTGADLVVMASHEPGMLEFLWSSHGGYVAEHASCSVFIVRG